MLETHLDLGPDLEQKPLRLSSGYTGKAIHAVQQS